ncbi:uracil phosphoribosyltransferase [Rhodohalobacter sulfatireducens]|uniref:Uracil phosphoribosyltransferase n=1 Tax=Rhodohalobacter sulfatireducens TaxID=2911366 RepID=A0ABS9KDQ7_9BACT|nr:uracil phosphoribosyltransferase [Rhodohalobacter sulfatireducens]MCG2588994.1 uracil phosphoribosyltransferase [Rhodohalobacter sulfatireducens]MDR9365216.1 uracil phosphoribosyltransferase [Balneolaceae bacterium]MDR9408731.1 uracil phosphoribosyltransferase [Balneolaceae bacterium]
MTNSNKPTIIQHPIVARDLTILRESTTKTADFRVAMARIATILAYYALKDLPLREIEVDTPITRTTGYQIDQKIVIVPILRAGLSLVDAIIDFVPDAKVGHLGMYRDETTHQPVDYYSNMPEDLDKALVLLVDPMLATGGSADDAIDFLQNSGAENIRFISLISAPEGLERISNKYPDVPIITAAVDEKLNDNAFIVPGLGDAGDRYFGTHS